MKIKISAIYTILMIFAGAVSAQQGDYVFYYKIENKQLYLRWMPTGIPAFKHAIEGNLTMELYRLDDSKTDSDIALIQKKEMKPIPYEKWRASLTNSPWDTLAITTVYADKLDEGLRQRSFLSSEYGEVEEGEWFLRQGFSNYGLSYEWSAIERSGLGFSYPVDDGVGYYTLKLYPTLDGDTLFYDINVAAYSPPKVPELTAKFKRKTAAFKWRTLEYRKDFFGWNLERSADGGNSWEDVFDVPLMNDYDTIPNAGDALKYLYYTDALPEHDTPLLYRLTGADFLGGRSSNSSIISEEDNRDIYLSPLLTKTIQTDTNYAVIQWEYDTKFEPLLKEFRIVETDTTGQNYRVAVAGISPSAREIAVFMKFRSNFYRVQAVSKLGTVLSSFESLVMMYDVDPPAVPGDFSGFIDSSGIAHLSWITSHEVDLAGYYLFKGYFENVELAMITPDPLPGPTHLDTVDMKTGNEWVYYRLRSVDIRGNGSAFTPTLKLKKPDIYPPATARIVKANSDAKSIRIEWVKSPSPDADRYRLFRKTFDNTDWQLLTEFDAEHFQNKYVDTLVQLGVAYSYTLNVIDDDGLESGYSQPVSLRLKDYGVRNAISGFAARSSIADKAIVLDWDTQLSPREYYLYKSKDDNPLSLLKVVAGSKVEYVDKAVQKGHIYHYVLRAVFADGDTSPFTDELIIEYK